MSCDRHTSVGTDITFFFFFFRATDFKECFRCSLNARATWKKSIECASWWSFKLNEGEKHHSSIGMAASLFLCTQSFLTKENIVKFLIRQKETGELWNTDCKQHREQKKKSYITSGEAALTLPSHDFVQSMELCLVLLKCISLIAEAGSSRGVSTSKTNHPSPWICCFFCSSFLLSWTVFSFSTLHWQ